MEWRVIILDFVVVVWEPRPSFPSSNEEQGAEGATAGGAPKSDLPPALKPDGGVSVI
eukprot:SAG11_NODE_2111_length_3809_cov_11.810322_3_plen_57_part_00